MTYFENCYDMNCWSKIDGISLSSFRPEREVTIQKKATIILYKVVLPFESVDEILKCDHSNESY